jgi:hypothetical protein
VLGTSFRREILDLETARVETPANEVRALLVRVARWIDGWNTDHLRREVHHLIDGGINRGEGAIGVTRRGEDLIRRTRS